MLLAVLQAKNAEGRRSENEVNVKLKTFVLWYLATMYYFLRKWTIDSEAMIISAAGGNGVHSELTYDCNHTYSFMNLYTCSESKVLSQQEMNVRIVFQRKNWPITQYSTSVKIM